MNDNLPTSEQISVLNYVSQLQRECRDLLLGVGLSLAASRVAQFEDPSKYGEDEVSSE